MKNSLFSFAFFGSLFLWGSAMAQPTQHIVYLSNRDGNFELYRCDENGERHKRLTYNAGWDWSPQWNGALGGIVYYSYDSLEQFRVLMMDKEGINLPLNTYGLEEFIPSPDGKMILFTQKVGDDQQILFYDTQTEIKDFLTIDSSYNGRPCWSPDGEEIAFISDRDGNNEIYQMSIKNKAIKRLTDNDTREKYLCWSPDGSAIAFTSQEEGKKEDIFILVLETNELRRLTNNDYYDGEIAWSPDGKKIVFKSVREDGDQLYTIQIDGTREKKITSGPFYHGEPNWVGQAFTN